MPAPWSSKGSKSDLVIADQFMILDSEDTTPATQNKRVTMSVLQSFAQTPWVSDIDGAGFSLSNVVLESNLTNGSIYIGDKNDTSADVPAELETKEDCLLATTSTDGNIDLTTGGLLTIDSVVTIAADRVLVKNQTNAFENGIYAANVSTWTRTTDADTGLVNSGMITLVTSGTVNVDTAFVLSTPDTITLGTTELTFDEFSFADIAHLNSTQTFTGVNTFDQMIVDTITINDTAVFSDSSTQSQASTPSGIDWQLATSIFLQSFSVSGQETTPDGLFFKPDGLEMYIVGSDSAIDSGDNVTQYTLTTAWDINTASFTRVFNVGNETTNPQEIFFRSDGLKMYVVGDLTLDDTVYEYDLTTAWNISTTSFSNNSFDVSNEDIFPNGLFFKPDGLKMYIVGIDNSEIFEYDLTTPWNITTATILQSFSLGVNQPNGLFFKPDGLKMYIVELSNSEIFEYDLTTPWDITTSNFNQFLDVSNKDGQATDVFFRSDSLKMYVLGKDTDSIYEYDLGIDVDIIQSKSITSDSIQATDTYLFSDESTQAQASTPSGIDWKLQTSVFLQSKIVTDQDPFPRGVFFKPDGLRMFMVGSTSGTLPPIGDDAIYQYDLTIAWDISTATNIAGDFFIFTLQDTEPLGIFFRSDGKKLYMIGNTTKTIYEYDVTTAWDITGIVTYTNNNIVVSGQNNNNTQGLFFKPDGLKMYMVGDDTITNAAVFEYILTTPWDINTASASTNSFSVETQDDNPSGIFFKSDGTKMYVSGFTNNSVFEYILTIPWDITTSVINETLPITTGNTECQQAFFRPDGLKMYTVMLSGTPGDAIEEYDLGIGNSTVLTIDRSLKPLDTYVFSDESTQEQAVTPSDIDWKLSTASFTGNSKVITQDATATKSFFKPDGKTMIVLGATTNSVYGYSLDTAWDVSTANFITGQQFDLDTLLTTEGNVKGIFFRSDGLKMYMVGTDNNTVYEIDLSDGWDISTLSFTTGQEFNVSGQGSGSTFGITFRPDGLKMYVVKTGSTTVFEYDLNTPWDITTTSFNDVTGSISEAATPVSIHFKPDGTGLYVLSISGSDTVYEYDLTTPWDLDSLVFSGFSFGVGSQAAAARGIFFRSDGLKMYVADTTTSTIFEYDLGIDVDIIQSKSITSDSIQATDTYLFSDNSTQYLSSTPSGLDWKLGTTLLKESVDTNSTGPLDVFFKSDGKNMFVIENTTVLQEYTIDDAAWDFANITPTNSFNLNGQDTAPQGIFFRQDGLKMYMVGDSGENVYEYDLDTAWSISPTAPVLANTLDISNENIDPQSIFFRPDGKKMYMVGSNVTATVYEYDLDVPWETSDANVTFLRSTTLIDTQDTAPKGIFFKPDGFQMFIVGNANVEFSTEKTVYKYNLTTPWDISTLLYSGTFVNVTTQDDTPTGLFFRPDGLKMYVTGFDTDSIYEYDIGIVVNGNVGIRTSRPDVALDVVGSINATQTYLFSDESTQEQGATPSGIDWKLSTAQFLQVNDLNAQSIAAIVGVFFKPDGKKMFVLDNSTQDIFEYDLTVAWDVSTAVFSTNTVNAPENAAPQALFFRQDGLRVFVVGGGGTGEVNAYSLSVAWDLGSTFTFIDRFDLDNSSIQGVFFKPDGLQMYVTGASGTQSILYQYTLTTPWDITTSSLTTQTTPVAGETPQGIFIKPDGTKLYYPQTAPDRAVLEYFLTTPWDLSTLTLNTTFDVSSIILTPQGVFFRSDGLKMYIPSNNITGIYEFDLGIEVDSIQVNSITSDSIQATDTYLFSDGSTQEQASTQDGLTGSISTTSFLQLILLTDITDRPRGIFFKPDGLKMFVVAQTQDRIYQYILPTAWDISSITVTPTFFQLPDDTDPFGMFFRQDGKKMYIATTATTPAQLSDLVEYDLSVAWDVTSATELNRIDVINENSVPVSIKFRPDGLKMYMLGLDPTDSVYEYDLSIPWDITSNTFLQEKAVNNEETAVRDFDFRSDGTKMYLVGTDGDEINEFDLTIPWDISTLVPIDSFSISTQGSFPTGIFLRKDNLKIYVVDRVAENLSEYDLGIKVDSIQSNSITSDSIQATDTYLFSDESTQSQASTPSGIDWKLETLQFLQSEDLSVDIANPQAVFFKPDGLKMFVLDTNNFDITEFVLGTAWDVSTATVTTNIAVLPDTNPTALFFRSDGLRFYTATADGGPKVNEFSLSVAWDVSSTLTAIQSFDVVQISTQGLFFKPDGLQMYTAAAFGTDMLYQYTLTVPWDISTASLTTSKTTETSTTGQGLFIKPDGTKLYHAQSAPSDVISEYFLTTPWDLSTLIFNTSIDVSTDVTTAQGFYIRSDGLKLLMLDSGGVSGADIIEFNLGIGNTSVLTIDRSIKPLDTYVFSDESTQAQASTPSGIDWKLSTAQFLQSKSVLAQNTGVTGIFFRSDGLKMYMSGTEDDKEDIFEYDLEPAWDITTLSLVDSFPVLAQDDDPQDVFFRSDGLKMYVTGNANNRIYEYDLSTAWDVSSSTYTGDFASTSPETIPRGMSFKPDGLRMYVVGNTNIIYEINLSTPWSLATAGSAITTITITQDSTLHNIIFKPDGLKMYIVGTTNDAVYEYFLTTPWDTTTAVFIEPPFSIGTQDTSPTGLFLRQDGLKMYVLGTANDTVFEYDLGIIVEGKVGIGTTTPLSTLSVGASIDIKFRQTSFNTNVNDDDVIIGCNAAPITITLNDTSLVPGRIYIINNQNVTGDVTVEAQTTTEIDGTTTDVILTANKTLKVYSDGNDWFSW